MIDWMRHIKVYFTISGVVFLVGLFSIVKWGFKLGVDFKGGTMAEYKFSQKVERGTISADLKSNGFDLFSAQSTGANQYLLRLASVDQENKQKLIDVLTNMDKGKVEELRYETVGPSIGPELVRKTLYGIAIASGGILLWVALQFKSFKYGTAAVLAMFHDTFNVIGLYSLLGHLFGAEIDLLFVTALLTTLSFSVHDTIVVYDRIRETGRRFGGETRNLANNAVSETMVRSLNNSFTIIFMLVALVLLGGSTIRWFAAALLIGTVSGAYSSPFVAVPILVIADNLVQKWRIRKS